jgi:SAM-dependent methyltransferase
MPKAAAKSDAESVCAFARELARRGARVTGIDISPRMIAHAKRQESAAPLGIDYQVVDAAAGHAPGAGGRFVASIAHACTDTPSIAISTADRSSTAGAAGEAISRPERCMPRSPTPKALQSHPDPEDAARVPYYLFFDLVRPATAQ